MSQVKTLVLRLYRDMLRIRKLELRIEARYHLDEMKTPVHLCIGQEAVAVGVCAVLERNDYVCSNHRGHGHYLAKGGDLDALVAELHCRETGCSRGRGGSMHLVDTRVGHMGSSAIVGGGIPIGTGLALASALEHDGRVTAVFFGDGAADEGVLYESVNFAMLKALPILFVYENNRFSVCSRTEARQPGEVPFHYLPPERLWTRIVDGNDVEAVMTAAGDAVERARGGNGPAFLEARTYRMRGHAGAGPDTELGYRSAEELAAWEERCPLKRLRERVVRAGIATDDELDKLGRDIDRELDRAFQLARQAPLPRPEDLSEHLFRTPATLRGAGQ